MAGATRRGKSRLRELGIERLVATEALRRIFEALRFSHVRHGRT